MKRCVNCGREIDDISSFCPYCSCKQDEATARKVREEKRIAKEQEEQRLREFRNESLQKGLLLLEQGNFIQNGRDIYRHFVDACDDYYIALCHARGIGTGVDYNSAINYLKQDLQKLNTKSDDKVEENKSRNFILTAECYSSLAQQKYSEGEYEIVQEYLDNVKRLRLKYNSDLTDDEQNIYRNCIDNLEEIRIKELRSERIKKICWILFVIIVVAGIFAGIRMQQIKMDEKQRNIMLQDSIEQAQKDSAEIAQHRAMNEKMFMDSIKIAEQLQQKAKELEKNPQKFIPLKTVYDRSVQSLYYLKVDKTSDDDFQEEYNAECFINRYSAKTNSFDNCYSLRRGGYFVGRAFIKVCNTSNPDIVLLCMNNGYTGAELDEKLYYLVLMHLNTKTGNVEAEYYDNAFGSFEKTKSGYRVAVANPDYYDMDGIPCRYIYFNHDGYEESRGDVFYK